MTRGARDARGARVRDQACAVSGACAAWFVVSQRSKTGREGRAGAGPDVRRVWGMLRMVRGFAAQQNGARGHPSLQIVIAHPCMRIGCPCAGLVLRMLVVA